METMPTSNSAQVMRPALAPVEDIRVHGLYLEGILEQVLDAFCSNMGFDFAVISLIDEDKQEICGVRSKTLGAIDPIGWSAEVHQRLDSDNIYADVLRSGKAEIISRWDRRFDKQIWDRYGHRRLTRVFVPLGRVGTIEAGYQYHGRRPINPQEVDALSRFADHAAVAIENAQRYAREQRYSNTLTRLLKLTGELQTKARYTDGRGLLQQLADAALEVLQADLIMLYPLARDPFGTISSPRFLSPIRSGELKGRGELKPPTVVTGGFSYGKVHTPNIVRHIVEAGEAYYQPEVQSDRLLVGAEDSQPHHSFTLRQKIRSFAGVPLLVHGQVLGVLCVNYRQFIHEHERNVIELFAQQSAAIITGDQLIRSQERRRLEFDLHDSVKSTTRALVGFCEGLADLVKSDPERAAEQLHSLQHRAWGIRSDIDLILSNLAGGANEGQALHLLLQGELRLHQRVGPPQILAALDEPLPIVPMRLARHLRWLLREAVWNALNHAHAQRISVGARYADDQLCMSIEDDGNGFDPVAVSEKGHLGLASMRRRAREIGGELRITSRIGTGTEVVVIVHYQGGTDDGA